jgi:glucose/arabinose dehydrogenase
MLRLLLIPRFALYGLLIWCTQFDVRAATLALTPLKDNTIYQEGAESNGAGNYLFSGLTGSNAQSQKRRALIAFDLAGNLPANAVITDVSLTMYLSRSVFGVVANVALHRLLADWGEGTSRAPDPEGAGALATENDVTWDLRFFPNNTTAWVNKGGDFVSTASASTSVGSIFPAPTTPITWAGAGMLNDVKTWASTPASNFGWIMITDETVANGAKRFNSRTNPDPATRPLLTVTYEIVPEPGTAAMLSVGMAVFLGRRRRRRLDAASVVCAAVFVGVVTATSQAAGPIAEPIAKGTVRIQLEPFASGLTAPNLLIGAPDTTGRRFILDQDGQVVISQNGSILPTPFLDVSSSLVALSASYDERGLLGMAFDPGFADPTSPGYRRIFTYTSEPVSGTADLSSPSITAINHQSVVSSWRVDPANSNRIDPATRQIVLRIDQPQSNHNGGMLAFGPDNLLYIGLGDGGGQNDSNANGHTAGLGNGQDNNVALGKILRIDVNGTNSVNGKYGIPSSNPFATSGGLKEIFASGFRNPYRFSFDGSRLLVGDVGQNNIEEVDEVTVGGNYGWRYKEGTFKFDVATGGVSTDLTGLPAGLIDPLIQYDHDEGISVIGGYIYRGTLMPELVGKYVFGDFGLSFGSPTGRLFYADLDTKVIREFLLGATDQPLGLFVKGMGEDENGELYVIGGTNLGPSGTSGVILKIIPEPGSAAIIATAGLVVFARRRRFRR